jgi:maltose O-acetyltransferase
MDLKRGFLVNRVAASYAIPHQVRNRILSWYGLDIDPSAVVKGGCFFGAPDVAIGAGTFVNVDCFFDGSGPIQIGVSCNLGMQTMLCTSHHRIGDGQRRATQPTEGRGIKIGDGCWIGVRATILPGVAVAGGCVIAAGAVLAEDTLPNGLYGGVPAARLRDL